MSADMSDVIRETLVSAFVARQLPEEQYVAAMRHLDTIEGAEFENKTLRHVLIRWQDKAEQRMARILELEGDRDRLDWLEGALRPLPWGGVYATLESDGDTQFRITVQPSSGDAPFINATGATLRATIDAAPEVPA